MNILAKSLTILDFEVLNIAEELISAFWGHPDESETKEIAVKLNKEIKTAKENLRLLGLEKEDPIILSESQFLANYNSNIMNIKRLINRFNTEDD
jgi:hypothetical protein